YGPHVTNQVIKQALHPYPDALVIVTKVGARRGADKSWFHALSRQDLIDAVHDNLRNLGLERVDVVNLRVGEVMRPSEGSIAETLTVLGELQHQGVVRHLGLSNVTSRQLAEAQKISQIVCVQNLYNVAHRDDDAFIDQLARQGIAYVPFFPLGGFNPLQSASLDATAESLGVTPMQVALAWLLQRSPNILLIPGMSSVQHLRENLKAATLTLPPDALQTRGYWHEVITKSLRGNLTCEFLLQERRDSSVRNCAGISRRGRPIPLSRSLERKCPVARRGRRGADFPS